MIMIKNVDETPEIGQSQAVSGGASASWKLSPQG